MGTEKEKVKKLLSQTPFLKTQEITSKGINRKTIQRMTENGELIKISRGLYCSPDYTPDTYHSIIEAQKMIKQGVICLQSALSYHEIGTQNPSQTWIAIPKGAWKPEINQLPIQIVRFSGEAYDQGIIEKKIDNETIRIYNIPKTIADCFKYRNKIGLETGIEALKDVIRNKRTTVEELVHYSEICRVKKIITPYLESII